MSLSAQNITKEYSGRLVLDGISIGLNDKDRIALVGPNGAGKSTLMRILAGVEPPDSGLVAQPKHQELGYLPQQVEVCEMSSVADFVASRVAGLRQLEATMRELETVMTDNSLSSYEIDNILEEYGSVSSRFEVRGGYEIDARTREVFAGLGISGIANNRLLDSLSGGERARVALASLLLASPDILLLDEPTNHLDSTTINWLSTFLVDYGGGILFVSHDRSFINDVCSSIIELDDSSHQLQRYEGNYERFLLAKAAARQRALEAFEAQTNEIRQLKEQTATTARVVGHNRAANDNDKLSYNNRGIGAERAVSRNVRQAQVKLERLLEHRLTPPPDPLRFTGSFSEGQLRHDVTALMVEGLSVGIGGRVFVRDFSKSISSRARIAIVGPNGAGKTTLLQTLVGELSPLSGEIEWFPRIRIGYLQQDPQLDSNLTPRETVAQKQRLTMLDHRPTDEVTGGLVRLGLLDREDILKPVSELSVGQQRKLELGILIGSKPDVLLLDEPTNHLALSLLEQFEDAVFDFKGPVIVVTHDRRLLERTFTEEWVMDGTNLRVNVRLQE
jgi:macrolide transport system ATP-binding/permease protein